MSRRCAIFTVGFTKGSWGQEAKGRFWIKTGSRARLEKREAISCLANAWVGASANTMVQKQVSSLSNTYHSEIVLSRMPQTHTHRSQV